MNKQIIERPILFNAEMVRAVLEGRKTVTRRVVKPQPTDRADEILCDMNDVWREYTKIGELPDGRAMKCPYGAPGDRLWVRETWQTFKELDDAKPSDFKAWDIHYPADHTVQQIGCKRLRPELFGKKRPSIFMPRWASRILLEVVSVKVERVQEMTPRKAWEEGFRCGCMSPVPECGGNLEKFHMLWDELYKFKGLGWNLNPWVWVVEFKRIAP